MAVQFRYAFVTDEDSVKVLDVTDLAKPHVVHEVIVPDARAIYVARTYAYVAAGKCGLAILDITTPTAAYVDQVYTAEGKINDAEDIQLGITNVSLFAYVADGKNGLRIVQLTSPEVAGNDGFSPRPEPKLIATYKLPKDGHAVAISRGMDRDRAIDESGHQIAVFGRVGARPLNRDEARRMYLNDEGEPWYTSDDICGSALVSPADDNKMTWGKFMRTEITTRRAAHTPHSWWLERHVALRKRPSLFPVRYPMAHDHFRPPC